MKVWIVLRQGRPAKVAAVCTSKERAESLRDNCDRFNGGTWQVIEKDVTE